MNVKYMYPTILNFNFGPRTCSSKNDNALDLFFVNLTKQVVNKKRFLLKTKYLFLLDDIIMRR